MGLPHVIGPFVAARRLAFLGPIRIGSYAGFSIRAHSVGPPIRLSYPHGFHTTVPPSSALGGGGRGEGEKTAEQGAHNARRAGGHERRSTTSPRRLIRPRVSPYRLRDGR